MSSTDSRFAGRWLARVLTGGALLMLCACGSVPDRRRIELKDSGGAPLASAPALEIENARGTVTVTVDPKIKKPVAAAYVYPGPGLTKPMRGYAAEDSSFSAEVAQGEDGPVVRVRGGASQAGEGTAVDISVRVPSSRGVTVRNAGGAVRLIGVSGPVTVENGADGGPGGLVLVRTGRPVTEAVTLTTNTGDVFLQIPPRSTGRLDLETLKGEAACRVQSGRLSQVVPERSRFRGVLNGGENRLTLRSGAGMVRVTVLDNAGTHVPAE